MNFASFLSQMRVNSEFAIRFQISENVSVMLNFSVIRHFGKLTVNEGFCAVLAVVCGVIFRSGHTITTFSLAFRNRKYMVLVKNFILFNS